MTASDPRTIALRESTPVETLRELATNSNPLVRGALAYHFKLPADVLEMLVADSSMEVRIRSVWSPLLSHRLLEVLLNDSLPAVCEAALTRTRVMPLMN